MVALAGCFSPRINSGEFRCDNGLCPEGFRCEDGFCLRGSGSPSAEIDAAVTPPPSDAAAADSSAMVEVDATPEPDTRCYGEAPVRVEPGVPILADTSADGFDNADGCNGGPTAGGPEHYYELVLDNSDVPAIVTTDVETTRFDDYDVVLRLRQSICDDAVAEFLCQDTDAEETDENRPISVAGSYFIIVDSHNDEPGGEYELTVTVTPLAP